MSERGARGYIFSRPHLGGNVPQRVQNLVIRDYCARRGLRYLLSATEYAMPGCFMMLERVLDEAPGLEAIVLYSLFQLPETAAGRRAIYGRVFTAGAHLHAALEDLAARSPADIERIEDIWCVRQTLPFCPQRLEA